MIRCMHWEPNTRFQYGLTCPIMRQHGMERETAIWAYGPVAEQLIGETIKLRASLKAYVLGELRKTADTGRPLNRPLWFDFPEDARTWAIDDAYMFGDDYIAAPILEEGARSRQVYLPPVSGSKWVHHYTGVPYDGGAEYNISAPLSSFPLFKRVPTQRTPTQ